MKEYYCPICKGKIDLNDINMQSNLALCRSCGEASDFLLLTDSDPQLSSAITPPRGVRIETDMLKGTLIRYKKISKAILFLLPFTCLWGGGSMWGIYIAPYIQGSKPPEVQEMLFGLPFLIGTIVLLCVNLFMLFGKTEIRMNRRDGNLFIGVGVIGWRKKFTYQSDTTVSLKYAGRSKNDVPQKAIVIGTPEGEVKFGSFMPEKYKVYIAQKIQETIRRGY